jgi:outer membrane PBP1 activator LpoA protein
MANAILALFSVLFLALSLFAAPSVAQPLNPVPPPSGGVANPVPPPSGGEGWITPQPTVQEKLEAIEVLRGGRSRENARESARESVRSGGRFGALSGDRPFSSKAPSIALILPSKAPAYSSAAQAVKAGFMAAAEAARTKDSCLVIEHDNGEVVSAFRQATEAGVSVMVGPLVRDDLKALLAMPPLAWTIALTQLEDEEMKLPSNLFPLTLAVESDARFLAREIFIEGREGNPVVLSNETPLMKRFADAFIDEWLRLGVSAPGRVRFSADGVATLKARLEALSPSAVVLVVEGGDAVPARAQTKSWPTYASGHIYQRQEQFEAAAFDRLHVVEIPWMVTPHAARFKALSALPASPAIARLYALGYDAFQAASGFLDGLPMAMTFEGATGSIRFSRREGLVRTGQLAVFENGRLQPVEAVAEAAAEASSP